LRRKSPSPIPSQQLVIVNPPRPLRAIAAG
jgi:hypothetical protein